MDVIINFKSNKFIEDFLNKIDFFNKTKNYTNIDKARFYLTNLIKYNIFFQDIYLSS